MLAVRAKHGYGAGVVETEKERERERKCSHSGKTSPLATHNQVLKLEAVAKNKQLQPRNYPLPGITATHYLVLPTGTYKNNTNNRYGNHPGCCSEHIRATLISYAKTYPCYADVLNTEPYRASL